MIIQRVDIKKAILQLFLSIIMLAGIGILVYKNFIKNDNKKYLLLPTEETRTEEKNNFEKALKVFEREDFKKLIKFGKWPVKVDEKGKPNPFLKFN